MSWKDFIASLVDSLAWPVLAAFALVLFRAPLSRLLGRLRSLRRGDTVVSFGETLDGAVEQDEAEPGLPEDVGAVAAMPEERLETLQDQVRAVADVSPAAAVPLAWLEVEKQLYDLYAKVIPGKRPYSPARVINHLQNASVIGERDVATLQSLRGLRNEVLHTAEAEVTAEEAAVYLELAQRVSGRLAGLAAGPENGGGGPGK